jgi:hypothetical protein
MSRQRDDAQATMPIAPRSLNIAQRNSDRRFLIATRKSKPTIADVRYGPLADMRLTRLR